MDRIQKKWWTAAIPFNSLLFLLFITNACLDEIELVPPESREDSHLILASLSKGDPSVVKVEMRELFGFDGFNSSVPVPTATEIHIQNEAGQRLRIPVLERGLYRLEIPANNPDFSVETGQEYRMEIRLVDGEMFESDWDQLLALPPSNSLYFNLGEREYLNADGEFITEDAMQLFTDLSPQLPASTEPVRYKWNMVESLRFTEQTNGGGDGTTCYITRPFANDIINIFDGAEVPSGSLTSTLLYNGSLDYRFSEGYYFTVLLGSISPAAFEYWRQTKELVERSSNMFEAVPGAIKTNFSNLSDPDNRLFGYFHTTTIDTLRMYISPEDADFPDTFCPIPLPEFPEEPPSPCFQCLNALGSALEKPHFWID